MTVAIPSVPTPVPQASDPMNFDARADAYHTALPGVVAAMNTQNAENNTLNANVNTKSDSAAASADAAALSAGATLWVAGQTYAVGVTRYSPATSQVYRCILAGVSSTDPSADATRWTPILLSSLEVGNTANTAVRITKTGGAGDALLVRKFVGDLTPVVINGDGRLLVGAEISRLAAYPGYSQNYAARVQIPADGAGINAFLSLINADGGSISNGQAPAVSFGRTGGSGLGDLSVVQSGVALGTLGWSGADGTAMVNAASISALTDGAPGVGSMPGRLIFSTTPAGASLPVERMRIDSAGAVGLGIPPSAGRRFIVGGSLTGATTATVSQFQSTIQPDVTAAAIMVRTNPSTAAASFALSALVHYQCTQGAMGAGSTVTDQHGFWADSTLIGATSNYGFLGDVPAAGGRWNFYARGTAANYFAGDTTLAGNTISKQPAPAAVNTTSTLSAAAVLGRIVTTEPAAGITLTLPTGSVLRAALPSMANDQAVDWSVINTNATNTATVAAATAHTVVGNMAVAPGTSAMFRSRLSATNTFITYRVG